jgi:hypothetical protein
MHGLLRRMGVKVKQSAALLTGIGIPLQSHAGGVTVMTVAVRVR